MLLPTLVYYNKKSRVTTETIYDIFVGSFTFYKTPDSHEPVSETLENR